MSQGQPASGAGTTGSVAATAAGVTRRALLTSGMGLFGIGVTAACGIRLEDDAPRVPGVPARTPVPAEAYLVGLWRRSLQLAEDAAALHGSRTSLPARLTAIHRNQAAVLHAELARLGVPQTVLEPPSATTTAGTVSPTSAPTGPQSPTPTASGPRWLAAQEALDLGPAAMSSLAAAPASARSLVGALLAQRAAAAALLGEPFPWPAQTWDQPSLAASFLDSTRSAVYGFQVVAAQSPGGAQRVLAVATLRALQARAETQEALAGAAAGPADLAYRLPFPVATPVAARRLALAVLTQLRSAVAADLAAAGAQAGPLGAVVQWLADTEVLASRWGIATSAFPGLR